MGKKFKVVFVHGTGVRGPAFSVACTHIAAKLKEWKCPAELVPCGWGDSCGSHLSVNGACIPEPPATRTIGVDSQDLEEALWRMMGDDPFLELRICALSQSSESAGLGDAPPGLSLLQKIQDMEPPGHLKKVIGNQGCQDAFEIARSTLLAEPLIRQQSVLAMDADVLPLALSRSLVALIAGSLQNDGLPSLTAEQRSGLVGDIVAELSPVTRGLARGAIETLAGLATKLGAMRLVENRRRAILETSSPASGDILLYQVRGDPIRDFIRNTIRSAGDRVIVLAHSLGGVACVDMLASQPEPSVHCLITVGSQAAYFHEIGALWSLAPEAELPADFPRWLNIYDPWDLLSYKADRVFEGRVKDLEIRSGVHFPAAHSAYWNNDKMWDALAEEM